MQVIGAEDLRYPVLSISRDGDLSIARDATSLETVNGLALRRGYFDGMLLIDADGRIYTATVVAKKPANKLWGFRFMKPRLFRVKLSLSETEPLALMIVRKHVLTAMNKNYELWDADGLFSERRSRIERASTLQEIMSALR